MKAFTSSRNSKLDICPLLDFNMFKLKIHFSDFKKTGSQNRAFYRERARARARAKE